MTDFSSVAPLFQTDAYKLDHRRQYGLSGDVTKVYSNFTHRKSRLFGFESVVHFGLQAYIQKHLMEGWQPFFEATKSQVCTLYAKRVAQVLGQDAADAIGVEHIGDLHDLGYLPLRFSSVPEGAVVPIRIPVLTVENTLPEFFWLTNYIETGLSAGIWQPSTSATIAHAYREILLKQAIKTGGPLEAVDFQCHDFSYRGMSSHESAAVSGAAHLLSFKGSDSLVAMDWIDRYYGGDYACMSVAATEHSVMSCGIASSGLGEKNGEELVFLRLLELYPTGILSVVSDTFDLWSVLTRVLPNVKDQVMSRDGKLVIRPDSGDPVRILCGNPAGRTPAEKRGVIQLLHDVFGGTTNAKGYIELDPHVGAIYGDSITLNRADEITARLGQMGFASTNVVFGVGSFTYQYNTRDTFGSAMKATWAEVDGKGVNLFKDPITDDGTKKSATGRLAVAQNHGELSLIEKATTEQEANSVLQPVWVNGDFVCRRSFDEVRQTLRVWSGND